MKVFFGIAIIVLLLLGVSVSLPFLIDLNKYQDRYRPLIEDALNRKVSLQDIRLTIWPRIGARVAGFTVQDDPSFRSGAFASLSSLDVGVKLLPLLSGRVEVEEITLRDPLIVVFKNKEGILNVSTLGAQAPAAPKPEAPPAEPAGGPLRALALLAVDKLSIDGGKLTYRDEAKPVPIEYAVHDLEFLLTSVHLGDTAQLHATAALQPYNLPVKMNGAFGPLTETLDVKHFDFDLGIGRIPISVKGGSVGESLDITVSSPLINTMDIPVALPLMKPVQIKDLHLTAHLDYREPSGSSLLDTTEVKDLGLALTMGRSVVNLKGTAARGIAHLTAASSNISSADLPFVLPLAKPVDLKNFHMSARAQYPPKNGARPLELADVTDFGLSAVMGSSTADVQGTVTAGVAKASIVSKTLNTADLPITLPLKSPVEITGLHATADVRNQEIRVNTLAFEIFNGSIKGRGSAALGSRAPAFRAALTADGLQLGPMAPAAGLAHLSVGGTAATTLALGGRGVAMADLQKTLEGTGTIVIKDGKLEGFKLMQEVASLLKVVGLSAGEGNATAFSIVSSDFSVNQGIITIQRLLMDSHDFQATGKGTVGFDQTLHLRLNMNLSQSISQRIAAASPIAKVALSGGRLSLPLIITGTVQAPSYRLDTEMLAGKVQDQAKQKVRKALDDVLKGKTKPEDLRQEGKSLLKDLLGR
ncbi:MAG TPA: AsmA family protein [Nitrospiraceae bacterium]|nr:AsmA family protein [Nitrospiraceae bacterium]